MNITQNLHLIRDKVSKVEHSNKHYNMGVLPDKIRKPSILNISGLLRKHLISPVCFHLSKATSTNVTYQAGISPNFYWLLVNKRKFAILSMPNPSNGRAFVQFINKEGHICSTMQEIRDSLQPICEHITMFNDNNL